MSSNPSTPEKQSLSAIKAAARKKMRDSAPSKLAPVNITDPFSASIEAKNVIKGQTGFVYDEKFTLHKNPWDSKHIECPERILKAKARCDQLGLTEKCKMIPTRPATEDELKLCHSKEYLKELEEISKLDPQDRKKQCLDKFHSVYMNESSFECAKLATGSAIELTQAILDGQVQNGLALLRPPGHHAQNSLANGFCLLNNVAISARYALKNPSIQKVLIVDLDVHHGQGVQYEFYDDPNVMYFSIHRYEYGEFWPHLRESNFDYIGGLDDQPSCGRNINIPLNKIGLGDADYLSIFHQVLLPLAHEFRPDLILVSAGYDAAIGCPEGLMNVSPAAYGHMINSLMSFADGRIGVFLEGGYFVDSVAEGVAMSMRALLGEPCLALGSLPAPDDSVVETNLNAISMLRQPWNCLNLQDDFNILTYNIMKETDCHVPALIYKGKELKKLKVDGEDYETNDLERHEKMTKDVTALKAKYELAFKRLKLAESVKVALAYDEKMMGHFDPEEASHPEQPQRIKAIYEMHADYGLLDRVTKLDSRKATDEELILAHDSEHLKAMAAIEEMGQAERNQASDKLDSIFFNDQSYNSALLAAGNLLNVVDAVCNEESQSGVAIIRPPGHHAEADEACGFCLFNNVACGAKYAMEMHGAKRILILDWDVHHGNGIQNIFYDDPRVLYISIHRFDGGTFFPGKLDADHTYVGSGSGKGFNINIPWNGSGMGDAEYSMAFFALVLPIAYQYNPDLVLISSGFDAARGDPLGRCKVSPEFYGFMTHHLKALANGKVIVALEGGYNLNSISLSMTMVTKALLGDPMPKLAPFSKPAASAIDSVRSTMKSLAPYWSCLKYGVRLPHDMTDLKKQMALAVVDFIAKSAASVELDYIPSQFGAYADTFGVNTLSDMKMSAATIKMEMKTSDSKKKDQETKSDVEALLENLNINTRPISSSLAGDPDVYIPNQYVSHGSTAFVNTISSSSSSRSYSKTTDSAKK